MMQQNRQRCTPPAYFEVHECPAYPAARDWNASDGTNKISAKSHLLAEIFTLLYLLVIVILFIKQNSIANNYK